jgi:hypothetical protein
MKTRAYFLLFVLALSFSTDSQLFSVSQVEGEGVTTVVVTDDFCPPLAAPAGRVVLVSNVDELVNAVNNALDGDTISIADGVYDLNGFYLRVDTPNVTLRSASGNREAVVLDGGYVTTEIIQIVASNVTIADLTLREAYYHPIHVMSTSSGDVTGALIYNVHIIDPGEQAIKINPYTGDNALYFPDDGEIACSHIELTDAGRPHIRNDCYTGGIDGHQARDWVIRDNVIEGFWCSDGLSEHGVHMWVSCRDTLVERNVFRENARGIGFGMEEGASDKRTYSDNPCPGAGGGYVDHYGGIIRNNFVFASDSGLFSSEYGFDCGICLWQACGARVLHNTVASTQAPFSSIEWRFDNTDVDIVNNLVSHNLRDRGGSDYQEGNVPGASLALFVDGASGDLHLTATATAAIDQVIAPLDVSDDIDGDSRPIGSASDVGADEYGTPPPTAVTDLRVTSAITSTGVLTAVLAWSSPADAITATLRYSETLIAESNWDSATLLTDTLPADIELYTAVVPYAGETVYFALKTQGAGGQSDLSNNAFWPSISVCLPLVLRDH